MRKIGLLVCMCLPNRIKIFFYNHFFGFKIKNSKIKFSLILSNHVEITDSYVGNFNLITCDKIVMKQQSKILNFNTIFGGKRFPKSSLILGAGSHITSHHYLDCSGTIKIGHNVVIGGRGSQIWTHQINGVPGSPSETRPVKISNDTYVGSEVKMAPGVIIGSENIVALGSVVTSKSGTDDSVLLMGNPARVIKKMH